MVVTKLTLIYKYTLFLGNLHQNISLPYESLVYNFNFLPVLEKPLLFKFLNTLTLKTKNYNLIQRINCYRVRIRLIK